MQAELAELRDWLPTLKAIQALRRQSRLEDYYPDAGPLRRELYVKHMAFFAAGAQYRERAFVAANRVGKSEGVGAYEVALHLTGRYPDWWQGRRFDRPVKVWAAGDTSKTVREIVQAKLLGEPGAIGTGMIPADAIIKTATKSGVADAIDTVTVRHSSGRNSHLVLKSYDQRRESFQGSECDVIWLDEECPADIYTECLLRTMTTSGLILLTFTPLMGLTDVVLQFLPGGSADSQPDVASRYVVMATWDDAPHLSQEVKDELWRSIPPYQRDARSKGVPSLGSGAIYPVPESDVVVPDFPIPAHWPRAFGLDVGWNRTAAVWGAKDRETGVMYLYSEHYQGNAEPVMHAHAIRARGAWVPGVIDPAARGRGQVDGKQLLQQYIDLGLDLEPADNAVEAGIYSVWQALSGGKLKVFASLQNWREEFRLYRRDEKGKVVKERDHLMDACRYLMQSGAERAKVEPVAKPKQGPMFYEGVGAGWMA